jgi:hypothetical protein
MIHAPRVRPAATAAGGILIMVVTIVITLLVGEVMFRFIDGYRLDRMELTLREGVQQEQADNSMEYARKMLIEPSFNLAWYATDPPDYDRSPHASLPADWTRAVDEYKPMANEPAFIKEELKLHYNLNWLEDACRTGDHARVLRHYKAFPGFVYAFAGPDDSNYPEYRIMPRGWERGKDYYNNFGFRGPDISPHKSARTIRLAFLGASTSANGWPFTYPEFVAHFLRQWAKGKKLNVDFDVINSGRGGTASSAQLRILRYEVAPLHPDIVVHYDGGNDYQAADVLPKSSAGSKPDVRTSMDIKWLPLEKRSALANRIYELLLRRGGLGAEPPKPPHQLTFDLKRKNPNIDDPGLPFHLHRQVGDLREMEKATNAIGGQLFLSSFVTLVYNGLRLDPDRHRLILAGLNGEYAPMSYQEIRDGVDFQNRVHQKLSEVDHLPFLDVNHYFPQDPDFFADMVHFNGEGGFRLQGWIIAQLLVPYIEHAIQDGVLPKPAYDADPKAIAWATAAPIKFNLACLPDGELR